MKVYADCISPLSTSIYKPGSFCVEEQNMKLVTNVFKNNGISPKRDLDNLILISIITENLIYNQNIWLIEYIIQNLNNAEKGYNDSKLVVYVGVGWGVGELLSQSLCLCLDINKQIFLQVWVKWKKAYQEIVLFLQWLITQKIQSKYYKQSILQFQIKPSKFWYNIPVLPLVVIINTITSACFLN